MAWEFPKRIRVVPDDHSSHLIAYSQPVMPPDAQPGVDPHVVLEIVVGKDGNILELEPVSGNPLLVQAALETVQHWKYRTCTLNGRPVEIKTKIELRFE
jgi:Gram-negative bacterial TonB protein C-terminal